MILEPIMYQTVHYQKHHVRVKENKYASILINGELFYSWVVIASLKLELHLQPYWGKITKNISKFYGKSRHIYTEMFANNVNFLFKL